MEFFSGIPLATIFRKVLKSWIRYRAVIFTVKIAAKSISTRDMSAAMIQIKHSRLLADLRIDRDKFIASSGEDMDAVDTLCLGFARKQKTVEKGERVVVEIRAGLKKLDERLLEFGNSLGDGKWVLMG